MSHFKSVKLNLFNSMQDLLTSGVIINRFIDFWFSIRVNMWKIKIFTLLMVLEYSAAVPLCTIYGEERSDVICFPGEKDSDFNLTGFVTDKVSIKTLTMKSCKITNVDCLAFQGLVELRQLDLSDNRLQNLEPCVLNDLHQLTFLNLSYNSINDIPHDVLNSASKIEVLDLKGNIINSIQQGLFDKLGKLKELDLSNNALLSKKLGLHLFDHNHELKSVDFSRNDMSEAHEDLLISLKALEILKLDRCFLSQVPSFATRVNMKTLKILILSTNQITTLNDPTVFVNLDNLEILNLAGNSIESIAENVFSPLRKVKTVVMKHNRLKQLPEKLFQNMPKLVSIDLAYNAIEQIQVNMFRNTPMKNLNISGNKLAYLPENFCQKLRNAGGQLKKLLFIPNPWQCACLREITEEVKMFGMVYNSARYDGKEALCEGSTLSCIRG